MSVYSIKGKGWRYDFTLKGERYTKAWFKTKTEARQAEANRRKEVLEPQKETQTPIDMGFLELVNRRLDHVEVCNSKQHYAEYRSRAKRWVQRWGHLKCSQIDPDMIEQFVWERRKVSAFTANRELRCLRATFNFALKKKKPCIKDNPTDGVKFLSEGKKSRYVPPPEDIDKVMALANEDQQDYLWTIRDTMARSVEVNRLTWEDVSFKERYVLLHTRKKKGGHLTPRKVPMTNRLFKTLSRRYAERDPDKSWVFWHTYTSSKTGQKCTGPYKERKRFMKTLCKKARVPYFRFHALRHAGASLLDDNNVPIRDIQTILGHQDRKTTETYLTRISESERDAIAILERATGNSHTNSHTTESRRKGQAA